MMMRFTLGIILVAQAAILTRSAPAQAVQSRPIDRATVRLLGVAGMERGSAVAADVQRIVYVPKLTFGTGVLIAPDLVATAAHVVEDIDFLSVRLSGDDVLRGAVVVAIDTTSDVALVRIQPVDRAPLPIPDPLPSLVPGEMLSTTGYPLDAAQLNPAAAAGALSRQTNEGLLELAVSLNPGNSGGPVLNAAGQLIGIVSARGRMDRGIQGIGIAIPISRVSALMSNRREAEVPTIPRSIPWLFDSEAPSNVEHIATPLLAALIAHREWRAIVATLVEFRVPNLPQLPTAAQRRVAIRHQIALQALQAAMNEASQVERYKLEELRAQLSGVPNPQAAQGMQPVQSAQSMQTPADRAALQAVERLEVRVPPIVEPRFHLRLGVEVPTTLGGVGRVALVVDVLQKDHFEIFVGASLAGGIWFDACRCFPLSSSSSGVSDDTNFVNAAIELGLRLRTSPRRPHLFGELGLGLEVFHTTGNEKTVLTPVRARFGLGVQMSSKIALITHYHFISLGDFDADTLMFSTEMIHLNYHAFSLSASLSF